MDCAQKWLDELRDVDGIRGHDQVEGRFKMMLGGRIPQDWRRRRHRFCVRPGPVVGFYRPVEFSNGYFSCREVCVIADVLSEDGVDDVLEVGGHDIPAQ